MNLSPTQSRLSGENSPQRRLHLGVMAKFWERGKVKTRLGATIGMQQSAQLHRLFCRHLADELSGSGMCRSFVISPAARKNEFRSILASEWEIEFQCEGDLGKRMSHWFRQADPRESPPETPPVADRILIGADCPLIDFGVIQAAQDQLQKNDVVIGPAVDGGYYLIGFRAGWDERYQTLMTEIPWSSDAVFEITRARANEAGLSLAILETMEDVDTVAELKRLKTQIDGQLESNGSSSSLENLRLAIEQIVPETLTQ